MLRPLRVPPPLPLLRDIVTELKLVWALDPPPPLAELELKPPLVEYIRRDTEDLMAVRGAGAQAERAGRKHSELPGN